MATNEHSIPGSSITQLADRIVEDFHFQGRWGTEAATSVAAAEIGVAKLGSLDGADIQGIVRTGYRIQINEGGIYEGVETISYIRKRAIWNIEWQEISKDIRTWLTTSKGGMSTSNANVALGQIQNWEAQRDNQNWDLYNNYKYDSGGTGVALTGAALTVAQKIMKGVQSYSIWAPVVTCTTTWCFQPPASGNLGKIQTPTAPSGYVGFNSTSPDFSSYAAKWLKNVERSSSNSDGTFTLVEGWLGADDIDGDLYSNAT